MNDARFSMRLPHDTLLFAQGYAAHCNMTLTDLVIRYFERLKGGIAATQAQKPTRNIDRYVGIAKCSLSDEEMDDARFRGLMEKYA